MADGGASPDLVTVTPLSGGSAAEVRVCSPDATGFGCDLARTMFDFGLIVERGDFSTDGKWSFLMFKVPAPAACRPFLQLAEAPVESRRPGTPGSKLRPFRGR